MYCVSLLYFIIVRLHKLKTLRLLAQRSYYFAVHTHKIPIFARSSDVHYLIITKLLNTEIVDISLSQAMSSTVMIIFSLSTSPEFYPIFIGFEQFHFSAPSSLRARRSPTYGTA